MNAPVQGTDDKGADVGVWRNLTADPAIGYGLMARFWGGLSGLVLLALIAVMLSPEEQGFYYTMSSILGIQIFFDMGLSNVIIQFASHEFAVLHWGERGTPMGDDVSLSRLRDLLRKAAIWFGGAGLLYGLLVIPVGMMILNNGSKGGTAVQWQVPWLIAVAGAVFSFVSLPFWSVIMGSGEVSLYNRRDLWSSVIASCTAWLTMILGGGLYAISAFYLTSATVSWFMLLRLKPALFSFVRQACLETDSKFSWRGEMLALQFRSALSWVSGTVPFLLVNPVLFKCWGAVEAGRMGMSLAVFNFLLASIMTWMTVKTPLFCRFIAHGERGRLDQDFRRTMRGTLIITFGSAAICWAILTWLRNYSVISNRFIAPSEMLFLFGALVMQVAISCYAVYLRAHKKEPLMMVSIVGGLLFTGMVWWLGGLYASWGIVVGLFAELLLWGLPATSLVWRRHSRLWRECFPTKGI